jgi:hypothetical protein
MKKAVLYIVAIFLVVTAIYGTWWWYQTGRLKQSVLSTIEKAEKKGVSIQYEEIKRKGFPFTAAVVLTNPSLVLKDDQANKPLEIATKGTWTVGSPLLYHANSEGKIDISGENYILAEERWIVAGDLSIVCNCLEHSLIGKEPVFTVSAAEWLDRVFQEISIKAEDITFSKELAAQPHIIAALDEGTLDVYRTEQNHSQNHFALELDMEGLQLFTDPQTIENLEELLGHPIRERKKIQSLISPSTNDLELEARLVLPSFSHEFFQNPSVGALPVFSFIINRYESEERNPWFASESTGSLSIGKNANGLVSGALAMNSTTEALSDQRKKLIELFDVIAKEIKQSPKYDHLATFIYNHRKELEDLIPDFTQFNPTTVDLDIQAQGKQAKESDQFEEMFINIKKFDMDANLYGIGFHGKLEEKPSHSFSGYSTLLLRHYKAFIQDLAHYYNRWQALLTKADVVSAEKMPPLNARVMDRLIQFLEEISDHPKAQRDPLSVTIHAENPAEIKIGTLSLPEFVQAWTRFIMDISSDVSDY